MPDEVLTVSQVAAKLSCSPQTVRSLIHAGVLPAYRVGKVFRIRLADLEKLQVNSKKR
jgi:excisionase family DNA binding protein